VWKKIFPFVLCAFVSAALALGIGYLVTKDSGIKLNNDLKSARSSLAVATSDNAKLADELRQLHVELNKSSGLAKDQQRLLDSNKQQLDNQKRIIDGIAETIGKQGGDIRGQIKAIAEGFGRLYASYHKSAK